MSLLRFWNKPPEITEKNGIVLGMGQNLDKLDTPKKIILPDKDRNRHVWVVGTTGVGKTRLIESFIAQDIYKGENVVVLDPKGDSELFEKIFWAARATGRLHELIVINPIFPEYSAIVDPLSSYFMPEELVAHITSGVDANGEKFFYNVAYDVAQAIVMATIEIAKADGVPHKINLNDVKNLINAKEIKRLQENVALIGTPRADQLARDLQVIVDKPQDYYAKISSSLAVALGELTNGNIGRVIGTASTNRFISRLEEGKRVIVLVQLGSLLTNQAAYTVGKVILSMLKAFIGRTYMSGKKVSPALRIYADEAQNILFAGIEDILAKAGSANVSFHGFVQSVNQVTAVLGPDNGKSILDNTNTKIFFRVPDPESAEYAAKHFGIRSGFSAMVSTSGKMNFSANDEDLVQPQEILNMLPTQFLMKSYIGQYRIISEPVTSAPLKIVFPSAAAINQI